MSEPSSVRQYVMLAAAVLNLGLLFAFMWDRVWTHTGGAKASAAHVLEYDTPEDFEDALRSPAPPNGPRAADHAAPRSSGPRVRSRWVEDASSRPPPPPGRPSPPAFPPSPPQDAKGILALMKRTSVFLIGDSTDRMAMLSVCRACAAPPAAFLSNEFHLSDLQHLPANVRPYICDIARVDARGRPHGPCGGPKPAIFEREMLTGFGCRCGGDVEAGEPGRSTGFIHTFGVAQPYPPSYQTHTLYQVENTTMGRVEHALPQYRRFVCGRRERAEEEAPGGSGAGSPPEQRLLLILQSNLWDVDRLASAPSLRGVFPQDRDKWLPAWTANFTQLVRTVEAFRNQTNGQEDSSCRVKVCLILRTQHTVRIFERARGVGGILAINDAIKGVGARRGLPVFDWAARVEAVRRPWRPALGGDGSEGGGLNDTRYWSKAVFDGVHQRQWVSQLLMGDLAEFADRECWQ